MFPLVSVIIPCKNGAAWLAEAIDSCLRQSWRNLEIIVVDNASSDASMNRTGPWDERLSLNDDGEFFCRVALESSGILFCGDAFGYYRSSLGPTLSGRRDQDALASGFKAIELSSDRLFARCRSSLAA